MHILKEKLIRINAKIPLHVFLNISLCIQIPDHTDKGLWLGSFSVGIKQQKSKELPYFSDYFDH